MPRGGLNISHDALHRTTQLIPGVNDNEENIRATLAFVRQHKNVIDYELLPYHRFGLGKYELTGRDI